MFGLSRITPKTSKASSPPEKTPAKRKRSYAAAETSRLTGDWFSLNQDVNSLIAASAPALRARVQDLVRNFPYFKHAVKQVVNYSVGDGIIFQARVKDSQGNFLTKQNQQIEDAFNFWCDEADVAGRLHYYEMMALAKRQDMECGEFLIVKTRPRRKTRTPFTLQMFEASRLDSAITAVGKNPVEQGIEYDKQTGEVIAYHLTDADSWGKAKRILADKVIHKFDTERPGQLRGVSPLVAAVLVSRSLSEYIEAELDSAKMAARWVGALSTEQDYNIGDDAPNERTEDGKKILDIENAIIEVLAPGEKLDLKANPNPNANMPAFVKLMLCMLAVTADIPYELLSGDYTGINYSTAKVIRNDFAHQLKPVCTRHIRHFARPTMLSWFDEAVLCGELQLPNYYTTPHFWQRHVWQPPGMESIDPGRETKAMINQVKNLLRSPQEIVAARGRNFEDVINEIAAAVEMAQAKDLDFADISLALANNPDKV
ncbi:phage portal protein, partial [bacterium]|nr:phage portal protein [bacterium]